MDHKKISSWITHLAGSKERNIAIVDFANVDRWEDSLTWPVSVEKLGKLIKLFSSKKPLRRFYYGKDYGINEKNTQLGNWSSRIHQAAEWNGFKIISKRVKYIPDPNYSTGYISKCNLDIEMAVDLIVEQNNYDNVILFSGDGDLAYVCDYLSSTLSKQIYVFCARDHLGKELIDAQTNGHIKQILFVEDFEYRLNLRRG